jgi:hypothetical protein
MSRTFSWKNAAMKGRTPSTAVNDGSRLKDSTRTVPDERLQRQQEECASAGLRKTLHHGGAQLRILLGRHKRKQLDNNLVIVKHRQEMKDKIGGSCPHRSVGVVNVIGVVQNKWRLWERDCPKRLECGCDLVGGWGVREQSVWTSMAASISAP